MEQLAKARPPKKEPCSCLTGCIKGILESFNASGGSSDERMDGDIYAEPQPLQELELGRPWAQVSQAERGELLVHCATAVKEDTPGWTNQDSFVACVPPPAKAAEEAGDDAWDSYNDSFGASDTAASAAARHVLLGVLDGHGRLGHEVSRCASSRIPGHFAAQPSCLRTPGKALAAAVVASDHDVYKQLARDVEYNGSTCVIVMLDRSDKVLHCANVGDSRAVLGRQSKDTNRWETINLTTDIKPDDPNEKERIEMSGGVVSPAQIDGEPTGPQRVWEDWSLTKPGLAMGRSIGDGCARRVGIISDPVMTVHKIRSDDRFLIIASDGLWDALTSEEAVEIASRHMGTPHAAPNALIEAARQKQEGELEDDTTIVMAFFTS